MLALSEADAALGHLQGLGHLVVDPQLLIGPYVTREALASSRIEGTPASLAQVLQARAEVDDAGPASGDIAEVEAYVAATYHGLELIEAPPLYERLRVRQDCDPQWDRTHSTVAPITNLSGNAGTVPPGDGRAKRTQPLGIAGDESCL